MPGENILVIDDELLVGEALKRVLMREKYNVESVLSGAAALELARQKKYDLAIIDKNMPGMNGITTCAEIRKLCPDLAVIMITGENEIPADEFAAAGGGTILFKPFLQGEVEDSVHKALKRAP